MKFRMRPILLIVLATLDLFTCSTNSGNNRTPEKIEVAVLNDSTVIVAKWGARDTAIIDFGPNFGVNWGDASEFVKSFNEFYEKFKGQVERIEKRQNIDVTGDGQPDIVVSAMVTLGDTCYIRNYIISNYDTIWNDKFKLNREYALYKYGSEKLLDLLKPYSLPFLTYWRTDFISDYHYDSGVMFIQPYFLKTIEPRDTSYWKDELKSYKGKYVGNMYGESGAASYIWDRKNRRMAQFYSE